MLLSEGDAGFMHIDYLEVSNFRNLENARIAFGSGIHWLVGKNGMGKTNCLEAIYFSLTTKSFRSNRLSHLMRDNQMETRIQSQFKKGNQTWPIAVKLKSGSCQRLIGDKAIKPMDLFRLASVIAFTARSKLLVEGQPEDRRRFLDRMIAYADPDHILLLGQYKKVLSQLKRELLRNKDLYVYQGFKKIAAPIATRLVRKRQTFLKNIKRRAQEIYNDVFQGEGDLELGYKIRNCKLDSAYEQKFLDLSAQEILHQRSMIGPHLDDLEIQLTRNRARFFASSGQIRAIVLSIKLAVREAYQEKNQVYPLLLLDDIDAELDFSRLDRFLDYLEGRGSSLITTSKYDIMNGRPKDGLHEVVAGRVTS